MQQKGFFVSAIGTDSGKTLFSAILVKALQANYWKPIQAGFPRDTDTVSELLNLGKRASSGSDYLHHFFPEAYLLPTPESPHAAARKAGIAINPSSITLPKTENLLVVEGAGGLMVPITPNYFVADLVELLGLPLILVSNLYLGSINHSLLSLNEIKRRKITLAGIVFNGPPNHDSEAVILEQAGVPCLLNMLPEKEINAMVLEKYAQQLRSNLFMHDLTSL